MQRKIPGEPFQILVVEDNPGDIRLIMEVMKEAKISNRICVIRDGEEAVNYLRIQSALVYGTLPDLILLDWNLPKKSGYEVLQEIKEDIVLRHIPVIILTSSQTEEDIYNAYHMHANCYISKPLELDQFIRMVKAIEEFWMTAVKLPRR